MKISRRPLEIFGFFFDPRVPVLFFLGTLIMAVMGNASYELVMDLLGHKTRSWLVAIIVGGILIIFLIVVALKALARVFVHKTAPQVGSSQAFSVSRKAMIFTVGKQSDTMDLCVKHQKPEFIGFLCTKESEQYADRLISTFQLDREKCTKQFADPWNVNDIRVKTRDLLAWIMQRPVSANEIVIDITRGSTPMSVGAFMIAEENRIDSQYVRSDYDDGGKRIPGTEEAIFLSNYQAES